MVRKSVDRAPKSGENVKIRRFGGEDHGGGGKSGFAIKSGSSEDGAGQKMGDGFQGEFVTQARRWSSVVGLQLNADRIYRAKEG